MPEKYQVPAALIFLSIMGGGALVFGTRWGIGLSPNSAVYIGAARNLLNGDGLSVSSYDGGFAPMTQYPPLFPSLLAGIGMFGIDPTTGVKWLHPLLFASNIFLVGFLIRICGGSPWASILGSFLVMTSVTSLKIHSMAWSEPLFIFLGILALFFLAKRLEGQGVSFLVASSLMVALAFLTRYAGIALVGSGILAILLLSRETWRKRSKDAVIFFLVSTVPMILWMVRNLAVAGTATAREAGFHPITVGHLQSALDSISSWLLPAATPSVGGIGLFIVAVLLTVIYILARREKDQTQRELGKKGLARLSTLLAIFIGMYGLMLIIVISFFDAYMSIDDRYLYPAYIAALILCLSSCFFRAIAKAPLVRISLVMCSLVFSFFYLSQATSWLVFSYKNGTGYASRSWKESKLMTLVKVLDRKVPVFSNGPDAIYLLAGRPAYMVPRKINPGSGRLNGDYSSELLSVRERLGEGNGVVVYFKAISWRWYLPSEDELKENLGLSVIAREEDGAIYQLRKGMVSGGYK